MAMTLAELLALFPDNTTGLIGADDMRTQVTELWNRPPGPTGPQGPQGDPGPTGPTGPKGDPGTSQMNNEDSAALAAPAKDHRTPIFTGQTTTNRTGAVCIPFTFTGAASTTAALVVEVDVVSFANNQGTRLTVEAPLFYRTVAGGGLLAQIARVETLTKRLTYASPAVRPRIRWVQESDTKVWLVIGDIADVWSASQVIVRRVTASVGSKVWTPPAGTPNWLTTLPTGTVTEPPGVLDGSGIYYGSGAPTLAADIGAEYVDLAATTGAIKWIKATGTSTTGWEVVYGDTGWRNITATATGVDAANTGTLRIRRINRTVTVNPNNLLLTPGTGTLTITTAIPTEFRPVAFAYGMGFRNNNGTLGQHLQQSAGILTWLGEVNTGTGATTTARPTVGITGSFSYHQDTAWPATLPGS